ncbi:type 1 glutamine amidotransferase [candidate division FCPU426 bacterium]|nr:type 1 glutamine amidotransferase [candidate division FCPU426 bacterium]
MKKIAVVIDDWFEDSEYTEPVKAFQDAGHKIVNIGLEAGKTVKGKKNSTPVVIDKNFAKVASSDFDALLIPGGFSPDRLRAHDRPMKFVRSFMDLGRPVFAICHGPQLMISADRLKGRRVTGYASIVRDLKNAGARFEDAEIVLDGNLLTSRHPGDLPAFIRKALQMLEQPVSEKGKASHSPEHQKKEKTTWKKFRENWWTC